MYKEQQSKYHSGQHTKSDKLMEDGAEILDRSHETVLVGHLEAVVD
jgi:hypothetical protein